MESKSLCAAALVVVVVAIALAVYYEKRPTAEDFAAASQAGGAPRGFVPTVYPNRTANYSTTAVIALDAAHVEADGGAGSTTTAAAGYLDLPTYAIDFGGSDVPTGFMMDKYCTAHMYKPYETMGANFIALNGGSSSCARAVGTPIVM
jgi:hypothetical protein